MMTRNTLTNLLIQKDNSVDVEPAALLLSWLMSLPADEDPAIAARELLRNASVHEEDKFEANLRDWLQQISHYPQQRLYAHCQGGKNTRGKFTSKRSSARLQHPV